MKERYANFQHPFGFSYNPLELRGRCYDGTCELYLKDPSDPMRIKEIILDSSLPLDLVIGGDRIGTYSAGKMAQRYEEFRRQLELRLKDRESQLALTASTGSIILHAERDGIRPSLKEGIRELAERCFA